MPVRIKICGIKRAGDALAAAQAGIEAVGINFVPESPRYIGGFAAAHKLIEQAGTVASLLWAGVFVNPKLPELLKLAAALPLKIIQLHGEEAPEFVQAVKQRLPEVLVWKAHRVSTAADLAPLRHYHCDAWLLDAKVKGVRGGSGQAFDWRVLKGLARPVPIVLSGGLSPRNVTEAVRVVAPEWVDVASGVETSPGVKNPELVQAFVAAARAQKAP